MSYYAIIVAGGIGNRMKSSVPKQFLIINNKPILQHTLELFAQHNPAISIILVLPKAHIKIWEDLCKSNNINIPHKICEGGSERFHSVKNGLDLINEDGVVAIHDGVRPLVKSSLISALYKLAMDKGSAIPYVKIKESVRELKGNKSEILNRENIILVQTPQCFQVQKIKSAYQQEYSSSFTDDASVYEASGNEIQLHVGNHENIKITTPEDLKIAKALL